MKKYSRSGYLPQLAFLGPIGTYTHQAAYERFGELVEYCAKKTITDVFNALAHEAVFAVLPQENSIFGTVVETYDLLRTSEIGQGRLVRGEVTLKVQHCLLVPRGVKLDQIQIIMSHEQALGQCTKFIAKHLPSASLEKTASTGAAALALLSPGNKNTAAICSKHCAKIFEGLEVLDEGIQDKSDNFTRFYILTKGYDVVIPPSNRDFCPKRALVRVLWKSHDGSDSRNVMPLLISLGLCVTRVDRRPSVQTMPFENVYFLEVEEGRVSSASSVLNEQAALSWATAVQNAAKRVIDIGGIAHILGIW